MRFDPAWRRLAAGPMVGLLALVGVWATAAADDRPPGLVVPYWVTLTSTDGLEVPALVWQPVVANGVGLVFLHEAFGSSQLHQLDTPNAGTRFQKLTEQGYWVIAPDYRGSSTHTRDLYVAFDVGGLEVDDAAAAIGWLTAQGLSRTVVWGVSHGANVAGGIAFRYPTIADGFAVIACGCDWKALYPAADPGLKWMIRESMGGLPEEVPREYEVRSLRYNADAVRQPILILHATDDKLVSVTLADALNAALVDAGKRVHYRTFTGGHSFFWTGEAPWETFLAWLRRVAGIP